MKQYTPRGTCLRNPPEGSLTRIGLPLEGLFYNPPGVVWVEHFGGFRLYASVGVLGETTYL